MSDDGPGANAGTDVPAALTDEMTTDPADARQRITGFIARYVEAADADGVVVSLSGGLDSTVTATLAVEALGSESVYGLVLPSSKLGEASARDAEAIAEVLGIRHDTIHVQPLLSQIGHLAPEHIDLHGSPIVRGNLTARVRAVFAYLAANAMERLVVGTTNRSERLLGYFTKYGDGAADLLPLGDRYKTEVRELARELRVPEFVLEKPPTAEFWPGQSDRSDLGEPYDVIDAVLYHLDEEGLGPDAIRSNLDVDPEAVERIVRHYRTTAHKRTVPPIPST